MLDKLCTIFVAFVPPSVVYVIQLTLGLERPSGNDANGPKTCIQRARRGYDALRATTAIAYYSVLFSLYKIFHILGAFPSLRPALGPTIDRTRSLQLEPTARGSGFGLALPLKHPFTYIQQQKPSLSTSSPFPIHLR